MQTPLWLTYSLQSQLKGDAQTDRFIVKLQSHDFVRRLCLILWNNHGRVFLKFACTEEKRRLFGGEESLQVGTEHTQP